MTSEVELNKLNPQLKMTVEMVHEIFMKTVAVEVARLEKASKRSRLRANLDEGVLYAAAENVYMNISRNKKSRKRIKNQSRQNSRLNSC